MPRPELDDRLKAILQEEEDRKFSPEYVAHLHSRKWAELRKLALEAAKYCCQLCNSSQSLHVHHRTYARLGNVELLWAAHEELIRCVRSAVSGGEE